MGFSVVAAACIMAVASLWIAASMSAAFIDHLAVGAQYPRGVIPVSYVEAYRDLRYEVHLRRARLYLTQSERYVKCIVVELENVGRRSWSTVSFKKFDVIARYALDVGLPPTAKWLPYNPSRTETGWRVIATDETLNPIDSSKETGLWDPGEILTLNITFSAADRPYYNVREGEGCLTLLIRPTHHYPIIINLKSPETEVTS